MSILSATYNLLWKDSSPLNPAHGSEFAHQTKFIFILWQPGSKNVQTSERQLLFGNKRMRGAHHEQSEYILKMGVCYMKHYPDHLNPQGRMMHICIRKLGPHSFITQANGGIFLTGYLVEIFSEILVKCNSFHTRKTRTTRTPPHDYPHYWVILDPKSKGKHRSRSKIITCDTPSDANDDLWQIWKECKQNCRFFSWKMKNEKN